MSTPRQKYTPEDRQAAVDLSSCIGVTAASKQLGIAFGTVNNWTYLARKRASQAAALPVQRGPESRPAPSPVEAVARVDEPPVRQAAPEPVATSVKRSAERRYTPSQKATILEYAAENGVTMAAKHHDVSRFSIYQWRRKLRLAAEGKGDSPTSGPAPAVVEALRDREILNLWHKHPGLGPSQIRNQLRRTGVKVAVNTVRRVMEDAGYRPPKVKRTGHDERYEAVRPNHLWHLDFVQRYINRASTFTLILLDDHSRFVVGHGVDDAERADLVVSTFEEAVARHGKPEAVMHDKGAAFWSWRGISRFTSLLTELGVDQVVAKHKEWNGKIEVFNGNLAKELFNQHRFYDVAEMKRRLNAHLHFYNHRRTSHALGGLLVPADRYYGMEQEVLARIEAGAGPGPDLPDLRDRLLELFKVVSRDGQPEIWLMGQRLLGFPPK